MTNKYNIILADPPWEYKDKALAGNRGAGCKYPTQSAAWLESLPVNQIAADDCALFLWTTYPKLNEAFPLIKSWGFEYKTVAFTWIKLNKIQQTLFWGMGRWTRANPEICLLATKGKPKRLSASVHSVIQSPIERHSKKPDETRDRIEQLLGKLPRVELFAREGAVDWDFWGNEVDKTSKGYFDFDALIP